MKTLTDRYFEWKSSLCADRFTAFDAPDIPRYITGMVGTVYADEYQDYCLIFKVDGVYMSEWDLDDLINRYDPAHESSVRTMLPIEALLERCLR